MKKLFLAVIAIVFNMLLFSCNPDSVAEELPEVQEACCGEGGHIPPPPPPPPPGGGN